MITLLFLAWQGFICERMIGLFFPTMTSIADCLVLATLIILTNEGVRLPVVTRVKDVIVKKLRLSSEVLPIMCVVTLSLVVIFIKRAPLSLKIEHIEICILAHKMHYP